LLDRIDSKELTEWQSYYLIEPFGEERADLRSGVLASIMSNAWRGKNSQVTSPSDFMLKFGEEDSVDNEESMKARLKAMYGNNQ
jgi:hypothetical protein